MSKILNFIISLIFPKTCSVCGKTIAYYSNYNICSDCLKLLPKLENVSMCKRCSFPFYYSEQNCPDCKNNKNIYFDVLKSPYIYSGAIKKLIRSLKYSRKVFLAKDLSCLLADFIFKENIDSETDFIVAVPMYGLKKFFRGYNQAELLAEAVSKIINKPVLKDIIVRKRNTKPQFKLNKQQRYKNLENMFCINKKYSNIIKNQKVLLIDDVATTGATLNECAKTLKENKAQKIVAVTLARAK